MPLCKVLRAFPLSRDGVTATAHEMDEEIDVPADLAPGLIAEKYVVEIEAKAVDAAPENKAVASAPENKAVTPRAKKAH